MILKAFPLTYFASFWKEIPADAHEIIRRL